MEKDYDHLKKYIDETQINIRSHGSFDDYVVGSPVRTHNDYEVNSSDIDFEDSDEYMEYALNDLNDRYADFD